MTTECCYLEIDETIPQDENGLILLLCPEP